MIKKIYLLIIILLISNLTIVYGHTQINNQQLADFQVFNRGNFDEPDTLDPQKAFAAPDYNILADMYEGLTTFDKEGHIVLGQAQSYSVSDDKRCYIFKLHDNLKWSNGEALSAYDFEAGIKRAVNPDTGSQNFVLLKNIQNSEAIVNGKLPVDSLGVKALDDKTIEISLSKPTPYLLNLLTHNTFAPIYRPNIRQYGEKFTIPNIHVSNGAFKLKEWVVNSHLSLVKNQHYRQASSVILKRVNFFPISQQSAELNRYRAGDLDYTAKVPLEKLDWLKRKFTTELYSYPMLAAYYYTFNMTRPPFADNKNLRKALSLAIDKDIIAHKILKGKRTAIDHFVPRNISNYSTSRESTEDSNLSSSTAKDLRLRQAIEYYHKAGYSRKKPLKTRLLFHTNESNKIIATAIASMWRKNLGVQTELFDQEWKVFLKTRLEHSDTEIMREGWIASYDDPTAFLDLFTSRNPQNSTGYHSQRYDDLIDMASLELDLRKRTELLQKAEDILLDDAPLVPIYSPHSYHLVKSNVGGLNVNVFDVTMDRFIHINKKGSV